MSIRPLFPFYGSKWRDARRYPAPIGDVVIEPFAGSAGYSLWHEPREVHLYDVDPIIVGVWDYLINAGPAEILALPDLEVGQSVDELDLPQEARWLIGFWLNRGSAQPKKTRTAFSARTERQQLVWSERARQRIALYLPSVQHWTVTQASYEDIVTPPATYFVDPPYVDKGRYYRCHDVDYVRLGAWVESLPGLTITCEQEGADWLPFAPLASIKSTRGRSAEAVYTNDWHADDCGGRPVGARPEQPFGEQSQRLLDALADCVVKATEFGEQDGGFVAAYILPTGPLHRAIPLLQEYGITVRPGFDGRQPAAPTDGGGKA